MQVGVGAGVDTFGVAAGVVLVVEVVDGPVDEELLVLDEPVFVLA